MVQIKNNTLYQTGPLAGLKVETFDVHTRSGIVLQTSFQTNYRQDDALAQACDIVGHEAALHYWLDQGKQYETVMVNRSSHLSLSEDVDPEYALSHYDTLNRYWQRLAGDRHEFEPGKTRRRAQGFSFTEENFKYAQPLSDYVRNALSLTKALNPKSDTFKIGITTATGRSNLLGETYEDYSPTLLPCAGGFDDEKMTLLVDAQQRRIRL